MRTSEIENLFFKPIWGDGFREQVVTFSDPEYFRSELPDALSWCTHDLNALTAMLSLVTNPDNEIYPSDELVSDCLYALNHITNLMKALGSLDSQAREQISENLDKRPAPQTEHPK